MLGKIGTRNHIPLEVHVWYHGYDSYKSYESYTKAIGEGKTWHLHTCMSIQNILCWMVQTK